MEKISTKYVAHSENSSGIKQTMQEHCFNVGKIMKGFAISEQFAELFEFCGLIHDIGKYSDAFQKYISGVKNSKVRHSIYGAICAKEQSLLEVALPVFGHHTGLLNIQEMLQGIMAEQNIEEGTYEEICNAWSNDTGNSIHVPDDTIFRDLSNILQQELFVRILFSSLVDADSLDTEMHFYRKISESRKRPEFDAKLLLRKLHKKISELEHNPEKNGSKINKLRNKVRLFAETKAYLPLGFFSLTLPTGLGKTLCSINWALNHAISHPNIKRLIIVLPYINIIDQTAEELKGIFNDKNCDYVLEHHSNVIYFDNEDMEEFCPKQLATENWDYPIIITTSVQFFESLFNNKRSECRKIHNIQNSIIIFDEIQTLPLNVIEPTLIMLDNLQQLCKCSILFCTATQPDFHSRKGFCGLSQIESLVEDPNRVFEESKRVIYHPVNNYNEITISDLANMVVINQKSALVVFNTKKKAHMFFEEINGSKDFKLFHLSTNMCPAHRKKVIKNIRVALKNEEYIIVSSTQLIEAGVDMDFPTVYRELAPLESIIQSAGRCNREGKHEKGDVYLFTLTESGQPNKQYRSWSEFANLLYKGNEEKLYTCDFYASYSRALVDFFGGTDKFRISDDRMQLKYQTVAEKYKIIDDRSQSVFIYNYNDNSRELYYQIKSQEYLTKRDRQEISQYSIQVYDNFIIENNSFIGYEQCGIMVWFGSYNPEFGLPFSNSFNPIL